MCNVPLTRNFAISFAAQPPTCDITLHYFLLLHIIITFLFTFLAKSILSIRIMKISVFFNVLFPFNFKGLNWAYLCQKYLDLLLKAFQMLSCGSGIWDLTFKSFIQTCVLVNVELMLCICVLYYICAKFLVVGSIWCHLQVLTNLKKLFQCPTTAFGPNR